MSPLPARLMRAGRKTDIPSIPYDQCAAKTVKPTDEPGTGVLDHCLHVGCVARELSTLLPASMRPLLTDNPGLAAALHDVGKVSPGFQLKYFADSIVRRHAPALCGTGFEEKHAIIGAAAIDAWMKKPNTPVAYAAAMHHGSGERSHPANDAETYGGCNWAQERERLIETLAHVMGSPTGEWQDRADRLLLAGLVSVADWIGSDEAFFSPDASPPISDLAAAARQAVEACGLLVPPVRDGLSFEDIFKFAPRAQQKEFIECVVGPGLYVLEAPMGIGKTEAALYAAYRLIADGHHHGLYFALPTRLTSDRIHERVSAFLRVIVPEGGPEPLLAHGMAWLKTYERGGSDAAPGRPWFGPLKRALLHPYAVGTIDQALLGVLNVRHFFVRLFGLAGKVVVLDEVHSYDMYTGTLLDTLIQTLLKMKCTVIVLSATLTAARRRTLAPELAAVDSNAYPLVCAAAGASVIPVPLTPPPEKVCLVRVEAWSDDDIAIQAAEAARGGRCVVCIANTVARAQTWFKTLQAEMRQDEFASGLLHARFPYFRRAEIEKEWLGKLGPDGANRPRGCVLVATQIVEQSVDIDADLMISELAPSDMLLQRMGRLWRHERGDRPCTAPEFVVVARDPSHAASKDNAAEILGRENCLVYAPYVLMRSDAVWRRIESVRLPGEVRALLDATYTDAREESALMTLLREDLNSRRESLRRRALGNLEGADCPMGSDTEDAATRYSDIQTRSVLIVRSVTTDGNSTRARVELLSGESLNLDAYRRDLPASCALHTGLVTVARYLLPQSPAPRWLDKHFHDSPVVLVWDDGDGSLTALDGEPTTLCYNPDYGVYRIDKAQPVRSGKAMFREDDGFDPFDKNRQDW